MAIYEMMIEIYLENTVIILHIFSFYKKIFKQCNQLFHSPQIKRTKYCSSQVELTAFLDILYLVTRKSYYTVPR